MIQRTFSTAHSHPQSLDSGAKPEAFAKREVELGSGTLTCTDHGTLSAVYDCYKLGKEHGLIAIPGLEAYFRDDNCPLLQKIGVPRTDTVPRGSDKEAWRAAHPEGSYIDYLKYYHLTLHFQDYPAYLCAVKLLSKADLRAEQHGSEKKPLFDWSDIEELAAHNVTASSSCLVGMVSRHLIRAEPGSPRVAAATAYFERLRHLFGQRFYVGLFPHVCTHDWVNLVSITVAKEGGTEEVRLGPDKLVRTNLRECRAHEWAKNFPSWGNKLVGVSHYRKWHDEPVARQVLSVEHKEGFYQNECRPAAPGGDVQWGCNKFALSMADKYKLPVLIEDDSHFAHPEEHVVQTVRLAQHGGNFRFHHSYHRRSNAEIYEYFQTRMGIPEARIDEWVETSHAWAEGFKGFKFDSSPKLPSNFFPADSLAYTRELITRHGREMVDPVYQQRLETEIELLHRNGKVDLLPYFQLLEECCRVVSNQGDLPGIGRGSAGGSLLAYYLEITHLDPIEHGLSFERFLTLDRVKSGRLPDIDQDLARRDWLLGFDTNVVEFEATDGTKHVVPEHFRIDTNGGLLTIAEIHRDGAEILYPWWQREPASVMVQSIVRSSRDPASGLPAHYEGYLRMRFPRCVAQVSTTTTMKLKAAIRDVARLFHRKCDRCYAEYGDGSDRCPNCDVYMRGYVPEDTEEWVKRMEEPPQNVDDLEFCIGYERDDTGHVPGSIETDTNLQAYVEAYPKEWDATQRAMGLPRSAGRHPCAWVVADRPIEDFIPLRTVGGERVTQLTAEGVEAVGGLKVDFLRVNSLGDVEVAIRLIQERHGGVPPTQVLNGRRVLSQRLVPLAGALHDIWALPDDPEVYADICRGETEAIFQIHTGGAQRWLTCTNFANPQKEGARLISTLADLAVFTALDRPGPLDYKVKAPVGNEEHNVLVEYYHRARGLEPSKTIPAAVGRLLPETYGVIVYQEQVQAIYRFVTGCTLSEAEKFRQDVAKKKPELIEGAYQKFMERGAEKLGVEDAQTIWGSLQTFSAYGFNKSVAHDTILVTCAGIKKKIVDFVAGDRVWCVDDEGRRAQTDVVTVHDHGLLFGFKVTFDDGYQITCSANHKFLTSRGQVALADLFREDLEILSDASEQAPVERPLWRGFQEKAATPRSSERVSDVPCSEGGPEGAAEGSEDSSLRCSDSSGPPSLGPSANMRDVPCCTLEAPQQGGMGGPMRDHPPYDPGQGLSPQDVRGMRSNQGPEHCCQNAEAQYQVGAESCFQQGRDQDLCQTGYSAPASGEDARLAGSQPGQVKGDLGERPQGGEEVEARGLAPVERDTDLARRPGFLRRGEEAGRLRVGNHVGGGGRILPLLCGVGEVPAPAGNDPGARRYAERGGEATRSNFDQTGRRVLPQFGWEDGFRVDEMVYSDAPLASTGSLVRRRVVRVSPVGLRRMCDLEVAHPKHNFLLPNGVVTSNSHATSYGATAYVCAWLKHHYPLEWWTAVLRNASAKGEKEEIAHTFWPHIQDIVEMPDIRTTSDTWEIVGDKIRAPASILKGLGDVAHTQLVKYAPYTDLLDFVSKMKAHQEANPTSEGKPGRNALHSGMVYSLIVSGVLDAFFPPDSTVHNALALYDAAAREVWGKKKKPIAGEYTVPDAVGRYQIRKGVLEIYNADLRPLLCAVGLPPCLTLEGKRMRYHAKEWSRDARSEVDTVDLVVGGRRLEELLAAEPTGGGWRCAAVGYVEKAERFKRGKMQDPAWDLILEVGGAKIRVRHWSRHDGTLPDLAAGAVIAAVLTRTDPKYGFNASSLTVLREPMPAKIKVEKKPKGEKDGEARNQPDREDPDAPDTADESGPDPA